LLDCPVLFWPIIGSLWPKSTIMRMAGITVVCEAVAAPNAVGGRVQGGVIAARGNGPAHGLAVGLRHR
jgi:hypothetical protein